MATDAPSPHLTNQRGQANVTVALALIILIVGGIWIWNHLDFDTQDFIVDEVVPVLFLVVAVTLITWVNVRKIKRARHKKNQQAKLLKQFSNEKAPRKRFDLASQLIELNEFQLEGLESVAADMAEVFLYTFKRSLGDKQHRFRGMAASYLGVVQHRESIPLLIKALEDDHAYVRSSAALALGRMRATEAKAKLEYTMKEDWDQTVRSRSREAVERIG